MTPLARATLAAVLAAALGAGCGAKGKKEPVRPPVQAEQREQPEEKAEEGVPSRAGRPRVPASPEGLLAPGAIGVIQEELVNRGLLARHVRGELDEPTSAALRKFQAERGFPETGMPDRKTLESLGIDPEEAYGR